MKYLSIFLAMLLVMGMASAAWYPQKVNVPVTNYDNITLVDDKYMFFGTGADTAISYDSSQDKFYINDTPIYLEEAVTLGSGGTVPTAKTWAITDADKLTVGGVIVPQEMVLTIPIGASEVDQTAFIADDAWQITKIEEVHSVAQDTAYPNTGSLSVMKCTGTQAPGSGAVLHNTSMQLNSTVETVVTPTLNAATGALNLADGNRIALNFNGTMTTFAGGCVTIHMKRI